MTTTPRSPHPSSRLAWLTGGLLVAAGLLSVLLWVRGGTDPAAAGPGAGAPTEVGVTRAAPGDVVRWIAAGGGATPESNQVSLETDLGLAAEVFGPGGRVLFAAGPGSHGVQVLRRSPVAPDPLLAELAAIFDPRGGRDATYRKTVLAVDGPASAAGVLAVLQRELARGDGPLTLYLASHGDRGRRPGENALLMWGGAALTVRDLASRLDTFPAREVRLVVTACFSGGFAEIAFAAADPEAGPASGRRCGLFASTWDLEASGCDPNPDRRAQEGYGVHFLHALRGQDRDGRPLAPEAVDFDRDGRVSLLEAHGRVRIASRGLEVPTTTSERWLRRRAPDHGAPKPVALPEDDAVIASLAVRLRLAPEVASVELDARERALERTQEDLDQLLDEEDKLYLRVAADLLARWPVLDDPWHPDFAPTLRSQRPAVQRHFDTSPDIAALRALRARADRIQRQVDTLRLARAPVERLVRALENRRLAGRLKAAGGEDWRYYEQLLGCERAVPELQ